MRITIVFLLLMIAFLNISNAQTLYLDWVDEANFYKLDDNPRDFEANRNGDLFFIGTNAADFNPHVGYNAIPEEHSNYDWDWNYMTKYDSLGNFIWTKGIYYKEKSEIKEIVFDRQDNLYLTGYINDTIDIYPGLDSNVYISRSDTGIFIVKYDENIKPIWSTHFAKPLNSTVVDIAADENGNVFLAGTFNEDLNPDPAGNPANNLSPITSNDIWVAAFDNTGALLWTRSIPTEYNGSVGKLYVHTAGKLILGAVSQADVNGDTLVLDSNTIYSRRFFNWAVCSELCSV